MYDYREAMAQDIREYIEENVTLSDYASREELEEALNDDLWTADSVTGNASGSYYCNAWKAEEALSHNWDLLGEAMREFCCECDAIAQGPEWADVTIRCYLLGECIAAVLDDMEEELEAAFSQDDEEETEGTSNEK